MTVKQALSIALSSIFGLLTIAILRKDWQTVAVLIVSIICGFFLKGSDAQS